MEIILQTDSQTPLEPTSACGGLLLTGQAGRNPTLLITNIVVRSEGGQTKILRKTPRGLFFTYMAFFIG
jgi:hypothetical protein